MSELLPTINDPADLRRFERAQLHQLAVELRAFVVDSVAKTGGHLSSNLGTVELTIALHTVFNTPHDRIVWDVGHQTYPHKILTGRRDGMKSLRQFGGMSGFPRRTESPYDTFGTAHSSTSISAALGMAVAARNQQVERHAIAVIGDSAMTGGMAFEAMNNVGVVDDIRLLVILNDNDMSISPAVGSLNRYLARLMSGKFYSAAKEAGKNVLKNLPPVFELAKRFESHAKGMMVPGTLFEEFGFNYIGPIDGHDLDALIPTLQNLKDLKGPQFLHVVTRKGQGYKLAEADPVLYHGPGKFDPSEGIKAPVTPPRPTYTQIFGDWICDQARADPRLVGVTPAMREGSGLVRFDAEFHGRYFDVGIAEQHAVTFAAGLACEGMKPVVAIYSTFLQRGYDQLIHDVALQNLDVTFAIDRGGLVGADGATHHGAFDHSYLRCIPNMVVMAPADEPECRQMLTTAYQYAGPAAVRYPRGSGTGAAVQPELSTLPIGKGEVRRESGAARGRRVAILAFGSMVIAAQAAAEGLDATLVNMRFIKPLDRELVEHVARTHDAVVTIEESALPGGAGAGVLELLAQLGIACPALLLGLPDRFVDHGDIAKLHASIGLDPAGIEASIRERFADLLSAPGDRAGRIKSVA
ncbi:MAG: 1-deoxy-D-xylulose-5-phosphate synthase [Burkholderiaceae bacterium]|jgi:1-deoxy-D-xylulose-5-phosphate synthase|nr:1-deoxy-D-xylulose-5-phosphate synthase [Burkholderiaceae bacterium]